MGKQNSGKTILGFILALILLVSGIYFQSQEQDTSSFRAEFTTDAFNSSQSGHRTEVATISQPSRITEVNVSNAEELSSAQNLGFFTGERGRSMERNVRGLFLILLVGAMLVKRLHCCRDHINQPSDTFHISHHITICYIHHKDGKKSRLSLIYYNANENNAYRRLNHVREHIIWSNDRSGSYSRCSYMVV